MNIKCPNCKSEALDFISESPLYRKYQKTENPVEEIHDFPIQKYLCTFCGLVFEVLPSKNLKKYNEKKEYFI